MSRQDAHPIAFAAGEAMAAKATVALIAWETPSGISFRTYPLGSLSVLVGMHDEIGRHIDRMREGQEAEADDPAEG